jgi:hypothetical protein
MLHRAGYRRLNAPSGRPRHGPALLAVRMSRVCGLVPRSRVVTALIGDVSAHDDGGAGSDGLRVGRVEGRTEPGAAEPGPAEPGVSKADSGRAGRTRAGLEVIWTGWE